MRSIEILADDEMMQALEFLAEDESKSIETLAKEALERYLRIFVRARRHQAAPRKASDTDRTASVVNTKAPYRVRPISVGRCYFENLDNVAEVLAAAEGEDYG